MKQEREQTTIRLPAKVQGQSQRETKHRCKNCATSFDLEDNYCGKCGKRLKLI